MRLAGLSYEQIGKTLDVSASTVFRWVEKILEERREEPRKAIITMELARLDAYHAELSLRWQQTKDTKVMALMLSVQDRRAKLLGLDAPTRVDTSVSVLDAEDDALAAAVAQAQKRARAAREAAQEARTE
jgi:transposase-like protein